MRLLLLAILCSLGLTAPTIEGIKGKKGFTVNQVSRKLGFKKPGSQLTAKVYRKYGVQMPTEVKEALAVQSGSVIAIPEDEHDNAYLSPVTIGGQTLQLDIDTGSGDLWTYGPNLSQSMQGKHEIYNPALSETSAQLSNYTWSISYGDGSSASGNVYTDTVAVGGVTVTGQAVEVATRISSSFTQDEHIDGLLGLSFAHINTISPQPQNTFFDNVKDSLPEPIFTVDVKYRATGSYDFGFIDESKAAKEINYVDVDSSAGFWQFTASGFAIGSDAITPMEITSIADTGTTLLYLPSSLTKAYYSGVNATYSRSYGGYIYPCGTKLQPLTLQIGAYKAVLPALHLNYGPTGTNSNICYGGVQPNTGLDFSILGDIFLKSQFTVFDGSNPPRMGFAPKPFDATNPDPNSAAPTTTTATLTSTASTTGTTSTKTSSNSSTSLTTLTSITLPIESTTSTSTTRPSPTLSSKRSTKSYPVVSSTYEAAYPTTYPDAYFTKDKSKEHED